MRLTCPRCAAQYEIAESAIPASGREVECSACGHVWRQPRPGKSALPPEAGPRDPHAPEARPVLNRPLDESVLAILREEAARELRARQTEMRPPTADHNPAKPVAEVPQDMPDAARPEHSAAENGTEAEPLVDWPAVTVTEAGHASLPDKTSVERPAEAPTETQAAPLPESPGAADPALDPAPQDRPQPVAAPVLPDAEELAATLTRSVTPQPDAAAQAEEPPSPAASLIRPAAPEAGSGQPAETGSLREAPVPAIVPVRRDRTGYATGFGLAAMLALGVVALYALAPQIPADEGGNWLAGLRQHIDHGRLWLHDRILGE
ncbi:zinc-ribbon domain-containing protein [Paracoccus sp. SSJ]|uniref:zinc-ribbon domain-containing protein n=1 Tax=Paracoccus sp. SSJ TaxID=3050636 RepID=UPI00254EC3A8|nr:zinc-ribbon domain-containing protein [Paracoccus sp. SSJ]MDK8874518.1 zinc-ribbon domain-containing protein [Paracoccus sp. SSJ]